MVRHGAIVFVRVIKDLSRPVDNGHSQTGKRAFPQVGIQKRVHGLVVIEQQGIVQLVVAVLQPQRQRLYLVLPLTMLLEHDKSNGKKQEERDDAQVKLVAYGKFPFHNIRICDKVNKILPILKQPCADIHRIVTFNRRQRTTQERQKGRTIGPSLPISYHYATSFCSCHVSHSRSHSRIRNHNHNRNHSHSHACDHRPQYH